MLVDPTGLLIVCVVCGVLGFFVGWAGGVAEGRSRERTARGVTGTPAPIGPAPEDSYPDQTILHAEGACGNCLQATIAGILGWPLAAVPHFAMLGEDHWWDCAQAWLNSQGYWIDYKPTSYAAEGGELLPRCWLSGTSPRGFSHAVVGDPATGQMLHDPHPSRAGLIEVSYTIYFFRKPTRGVPVARGPYRRDGYNEPYGREKGSPADSVNVGRGGSDGR